LISRQDVLKAIESVILDGSNPTVTAVKLKLNSKSEATIYKYLHQWKQQCFMNMVTNKVNFEQIESNLEEKDNQLKLELQKQLYKNEHYTQELIAAEKANIALKEENRQLQTANQELQLRLTAATATNNTLEQVTQKIQHELNLNTNETIRNMQQTIDGLRAELKILNETSLSALRDTSNKGHEALMQEKVTGINLQAKIDGLTKELLENKKQLNEAITSAQLQTRSLLRQNGQLQKIIQEHGLDKLPQLEEELRLNFNTKEAAFYGK